MMNEDVCRGVARAWSRRARCAFVCAGLVAMVACGCPYAGLPEALTPYDLENDPDGDGSLETARPLQWVSDQAKAVGGISIDPGNLLAIQSFLGSEIIGLNMPPASEVDVFALGPLEAGDQIRVSAESLVQQIVNLTPLARSEMIRNTTSQAVFLVDASREIVGYPVAAPVTIDRPDDYFIVVQSFVPGDYVLTVQRLRDAPPRPPRRGVLLLQFEGSDSDVTFLEDGHLITVRDLPPFDLEEARPDFVGQSARFQETLRQFVESIFADYDVLVTLDAAEAEAAGHYDTLVFTVPSPSDLGFSESGSRTLGIEPTIDVEDQGNQLGIVFIQAYEESRYLDFNSYAAFWSTVAAHEYGHAVGLWHVEQGSGCLMGPSLGGLAEPRRLKPLRSATKAEAHGRPSLQLVQNPDRYLARVLGRRDPERAEAVRQAARALLPDFSVE
ncbi:MAG TPA: hypothetical protein PK458_12535 [Phycisphaerae bacterium]|nr:hypothetical protein [Phycisphaerae bacterium]HPP26010.1 hypothetical protein [Phycisphaerae bacterium]HPU27001.1 hypothetical protein [Phycisphaerae bacterium]